MELALDYLNQAAAPPAQPSMLEPPKPVDRMGLLKSARQALNKAPAIYKGRKAKAQEYVDVALEQLKRNEESKASPTSTKPSSRFARVFALCIEARG